LYAFYFQESLCILYSRTKSIYCELSLHAITIGQSLEVTSVLKANVNNTALVDPECFTKWLKLDQNKQGHPRPYALRALHIEHKSVQTCTPAGTCVCKDTTRMKITAVNDT